jgi:hypothetical protein
MTSAEPRRQSEQINELAKALSDCQGEFERIPKDCTAKVVTRGGQSYSFKYADLETILAVVRPVLSRHGLAMTIDVQSCEVDLPPEQGKPSKTLGMAAVVTLLHMSGQWRESRPLAIPVDPEALRRQYAQAVGSAATYATRYAVEAALSIRATEDTDGSEASGNATTVERPAPRPAPEPPAKPTLLPALADFFNEFAWPKESKVQFANELLAHYAVTLSDCMANPATAGGVLNGLQAEVKAIMQAENCDRLTALQILMEQTMEGKR